MLPGVVLGVAALLCSVCPASSINCPGCTPLDDLSFDKLVSKFHASLVKFDVAYPYGDQHEEFAKVAKEAAESEDLFIGEVGIKDYADRVNENLGRRFNIKKEDYPVALLFVHNEKHELEQYTFTGTFTADDLKKFVRKNSGIYLSLPGCIEAFDKLVDKLLVTRQEERGAVVREAEQLWDRTHGPSMSRRADTYVKIMRKVADTGDTFVKTETDRVKKLLAGKISAEKKENLEEKLNILKSFISLKVPAKDEL